MFHTVQPASVDAASLFTPTVISRACIIVGVVLATGCAFQQPPVPPALEFPRTNDSRLTGDLGAQRVGPPTETVIRPSPKPPVPIAGNLRPIAAKAAPDETGGILTVNVDQMALPSFIQAIYGGILKLNYSVDPAVSARTDLITFRTPKALSAERLAQVSSQLLKSYGIAVQDFNGVLRLVPDANISSTLPMIRRGRAQPGVPLPLRPIFHYVETESLRASIVQANLTGIMGSKVTFLPDSTGSAIILSGQPEDVGVALELIAVFDQPGARSQNTTRIVPRYWGAEEFSRRLSEVLRVEGYSVANQAATGEPIAVIAIAPVNSVLLFASSKESLAHILDWARELDQLPTVQAGNAFFNYPVRYADAKELASSLNELISGGSTSTSASTSAVAGASTSTGAPGSTATRGRRVVVNNATNSLIFQGGSQDDYRQWLSLLAELDKPVKSALIDVLVAEVALADNNDLGFVWRLDQLGSGASPIRLNGTTYNATASGAGLAISALLGGNPLRQLAINALASNSDARVMSNPKILTRNGESATINVGQEVPVVTSQAVTQSTGVLGGSSNVVPQTVQYRSTGVILRVRPVIHAGDRIDIEISQEVSSAEPTSTGVSTSPTIRKRSVETKLSLRDGATVMLGGLISDSNTDSNSGIPGLKDIPIIGSLFRSQTKAKSRTELVMLITPYILNDSADAEAATDSFQNTLGSWADGVRARVKAQRDVRINLRGGMVEPLLELPAQTPQLQPNTAPKPPVSKATESPSAVPVLSPNKAADSVLPSAVVPADQTNRMINFGNAGKDQGGSVVPSNPTSITNTQASPAASPGTPGVAGTAAPKTVNGFDTPPGSTVVEDPKLLQELLDLVRSKK